MHDQIIKVAAAAAKESGRMLKREYKNFNRATIKLKSHHEILTKADLKSEEILIKTIKKHFPAHSILSEESGTKFGRTDYLWIIDPIDGTTNFSIHNPLWSVSLGIAYKNEMIAGVVYIPELEEMFSAEKDKGARLNGRMIKVSSVKAGKVINTFCHGRNTRDIKRAIKYYAAQKLKELDCRQMGSAAIELAYVASGRIESITIPGANVWDVAAGVLLVREAGGWVTDFTGKEWTVDSKDMLATNGKVHRGILKVINKK